jgi:hypothetical protein
METPCKCMGEYFEGQEYLAPVKCMYLALFCRTGYKVNGMGVNVMVDTVSMWLLKRGQ